MLFDTVLLEFSILVSVQKKRQRILFSVADLIFSFFRWGTPIETKCKLGIKRKIQNHEKKYR